MKLLSKVSAVRSNARTAHAVHYVMSALLPIVLFVLVYFDFGWVAIGLTLLSKWRIFTVKLRHWPILFRANAVDVFFALSSVLFMINVSSLQFRLLWLGVFILWQVALKPLSSKLGVGLQSLIAQGVALSALFYNFADASLIVLVFSVWSITYLSARHFLAVFDESMSRGTAYLWALFSAAIAWVLSHWLIYYGPVAQPVLLISSIGYGASMMYFLEHTGRLSKAIQRQTISIMVILVLVIIIFSDWSDITI